MKLMKIVMTSLCLFLSFMKIEATPTSLFWTSCTTDVLEMGTGHFDLDSYFAIQPRHGFGSRLNSDSFIDTGFTLGLLTWHDFQLEAGVDYLPGKNHPIFVNAKIGIAEGKLFGNAPSLSLGYFNAGIKTQERHNKANQNVFDFVLGLSDCKGGRMFLGGYVGSKALGRDNVGFMVGIEQGFYLAKYCDDIEYYKWMVVGDYASGKNALGGGGVAIAYYFTPSISIETGPIWFHDTHSNGSWKWSLQLDISFPVF